MARSQSSLSGITSDRRILDVHVRQSNHAAPSIASSLGQSAQVRQAASQSTQNSGFFQGASNVDASHGTFNYVKGNQQNNYIQKSSVSLELEVRQSFAMMTERLFISLLIRKSI
jgi:hypothetical protein